jgi:hypothetical protein
LSSEGTGDKQTELGRTEKTHLDGLLDPSRGVVQPSLFFVGEDIVRALDDRERLRVAALVRVILRGEGVGRRRRGGVFASVGARARVARETKRISRSGDGRSDLYTARGDGRPRGRPRCDRRTSHLGDLRAVRAADFRARRGLRQPERVVEVHLFRGLRVGGHVELTETTSRRFFGCLDGMLRPGVGCATVETDARARGVSRRRGGREKMRVRACGGCVTRGVGRARRSASGEGGDGERNARAKGGERLRRFIILI